ncbi:MAG: 1-acyl-sn-glycerol-3-phosphate acyltransferase [Alistipes sp.]|nr:1-acyl-sn-glycerol-3-phosphate acyltransferase [Alistipes sp.]
MGKNIQDHDWLYSFLRHYVDLVLKLSYRTIRYVGKDRIPKDGAIIYAPNHTNALMDAMVVLAMDSKAKVFVARADIFKNPKIAKILHFLKIMPIMRMRDGRDEVRKNNETIERAVGVLRDKVPFCIFPEGTHQAKYSSLPLAKGIFRIAFQAQELMSDMPLYIVPIGIRYGNFFRFRSTVRVAAGVPINVAEFRNDCEGLNEQEQMNAMKTLLEERLQDAIFYIPNDENYDSIYEICAAVVKSRVKRAGRDMDGRVLRGLEAHFATNKSTLKLINRIREEKPEEAQRLLTLGHEASTLRRDRKISLSSVSVKNPVLSRLLMTLFMIVTLPYNLVALILTLPIKGLCAFLFTKMKDYAFRNSVRYVVNLVLWPILMIIYSAVAYAVLPWEWALPITLLLLPAPIIAHEAWRLARLMKSDIRLLCSEELREKYRGIREIIERNDNL